MFTPKDVHCCLQGAQATPDNDLGPGPTGYMYYWKFSGISKSYIFEEIAGVNCIHGALSENVFKLSMVPMSKMITLPDGYPKHIRLPQIEEYLKLR